RLVELFETVLPQVCAAMEQSEATGDDRLLTADQTDRSQSNSSDTGAAGSRKPAVVNPPAGSPHSALAQISQAAAEMAAVCTVAHSLAEQETLDQVSSVIVERALAL